jgi:aminoglycoside phosphotransferase (APT) family kinase protein
VAGGRIISTRSLRGGTASAVHLLVIRLAGGRIHRVVLRREVRPEVLVEDPDAIDREQHALRVVEALELPTPRLLGCDPSGSRAGAPALLMSALPGRVEWSPPNPERWLDGLAALLPPIHGLVVPPGLIRPYRPYAQRGHEPPPWASRPDVWRRAVEVFRGPPDLPVTFLHRDFHPGNVLWRRGRVSGVVDWQAASVGPSCVDVGHCRANLLRYGRGAAEQFTRIWERRTANTYHPWADVVAIIGRLDELRKDPGSHRWAIEDTLTQAMGPYMP